MSVILNCSVITYVNNIIWHFDMRENEYIYPNTLRR